MEIDNVFRGFCYVNGSGLGKNCVKNGKDRKDAKDGNHSVNDDNECNKYIQECDSNDIKQKAKNNGNFNIHIYIKFKRKVKILKMLTQLLKNKSNSKNSLLNSQPDSQ